jgi:hypothetical protein
VGLFDKIFGGSKEKSDTAVIEKPACLHTALVPRWDSIDDIGHEDRVTYFICEGCEERFSPEEAQAHRAAATEKLIGGADTEN